MKDIKQAMAAMQSKMQQINVDNQQTKVRNKQVAENAKLVIDELFNELKSSKISQFSICASQPVFIFFCQ